MENTIMNEDLLRIMIHGGNLDQKVIDKMIKLTGKTSWRRFKARTAKTNEEVEIHQFGEFSAIKNHIESKEIEILYDGKIYSVNDFLNL